MAKVVNLNLFRKARRKADKQAESAANRVKSGRTRAEKAADAADRAKRRKTIDDAKLDPSA
tara:strand:+ start:1357 stop:1539 length:183 start_codon:yes stop_codon:yes gene_type:complete